MKSFFSWIFFPIAFWISSIHCDPDSDYAYPRILILGPTGVGKSSLASVLAGCAPGDCLFPVCTSINSCTKNTSIAQAKFIGNFSGPGVLKNVGNVTIIDTPGFGDGDLEEPKLVGEMVDVLKEDLKSANVILLCFDGIRWDAQINAMLETLQTLFGQNLWRNTIIEVTKWSFHEKDIQDRKRRRITEEDTLMAINNQLKKNFNLNHSLPGVFLDSFAVHYPDDEVQIKFFQKYSKILWEAAMDKKPFFLDTVGLVQDGKTKACGIDIDCCDFLTNEINAVKSSISDLVISDENLNGRIDHFNERLNDNTMKIVNNKLTIDSNIDNINSNTHDIANNRETIDTLTETTSSFVSYCGLRQHMEGTGTLTYDQLVTSLNSFSVDGLDRHTGVFNAPTQGIYLVTQNYITYGTGTYDVYVNKNGNNLDEGDTFSVRVVGNDREMTGRSITVGLQKNDKLYLNVGTNQGAIRYTTFCVTLIK